VRPPVWTIEQLFRGSPLIVVLDGLQDPGNAGTIIRTAEAFGATGLLFVKGTVNPFNAKALRASAGSLFRIPFLYAVDAALARAALRQHKVELYAAVPKRPGAASVGIDEVDLSRRCGIVIGSEGHGVGEDLRGSATDVSIPTVGVESLNAAVAAGILLYEARRQRAVA
jgi:RNA methyltransferase, TrmH family